MLKPMVYHAICLFMRTEKHFVYVGGETIHVQCAAIQALKFSVYIFNGNGQILMVDRSSLNVMYCISVVNVKKQLASCSRMKSCSLQICRETEEYIYIYIVSHPVYTQWAYQNLISTQCTWSYCIILLCYSK